LTVALQMATDHGGHLEVECPPTGGTCVTINLPVVPPCGKVLWLASS
jgi:hypothetical protein